MLWPWKHFCRQLSYFSSRGWGREGGGVRRGKGEGEGGGGVGRGKEEGEGGDGVGRGEGREGSGGYIREWKQKGAAVHSS